MKFTWTTTVEIEAESEEDSYVELIDMDTHNFRWELEEATE